MFANRDRWKSVVLVVLCIAAAQYYYRITHPNKPFWDENYYIATTERYKAGIAQLEPHPPLGILLVAAGEILTGANKSISTRHLANERHVAGEQLPVGYSFFGIRLFPSIFAILSIAIFSAIIYRGTGNHWLAVGSSILLTFENSFITHFGAAHLDSIQLFFFLAAVNQFLIIWQRDAEAKNKELSIFGVWCACATLVKVNSIVLVALIPLLVFRDWQKSKSHPLAYHLDGVINKLGSFVGAGFAFTLIVFSLHIAMGNSPPDKQSPAGSVTWSNSSIEYKTYFNGEGAISPGLVFYVIRDYVRFVQKDHRGVPKLDVCKPGENGSHPSSWPFNRKTINYRWDSNNGKTRYIQLSGNQVNWILGIFGLLSAVSITLGRRLYGAVIVNQASIKLIEPLFLLYVVYMAITFYLAEQRVMYLYHYFIGLCLSLIMAALAVASLLEIRRISQIVFIRVLVGFLFISISNFIWLSPLSFHLPLTKQQCLQRNFIQQVVDCQ